MAMLEIACFSAEAAIIAASAGADRIELCDDQAGGGTTPPLEWLREVKTAVSIPVFVMVRPRAGDFAYSDPEFETMEASIQRLKPLADGFVLGVLKPHREVDVARTAKLVESASPLPCTFHRAFDSVLDLSRALEDVIATGCQAILSSGGEQSALDGSITLRKLVEASPGRIEIIPGGGVRAENISHIRHVTTATVFHTAATLQGGSLPDVQEVRSMKHAIQASCSSHGH